MRKKVDSSASKREIGGVAAILISISFIFSLDLMVPKVTGGVIASGNVPIDVSTGLVLFIVCIIAFYFAVKKQSSENKLTKQKKPKTRKSKPKNSRKPRKK